MKLKFSAFVLIALPITADAQDTKDSAEKNWSASVAAYCYFVEGEQLHPIVIAAADYKSLHIEARYNYEDVNTTSLFAGYTWEKSGKLNICVTPMAGIAAGNTNGFLPGLELNASFSRLHFYSENEYMIDFKGKKNCFFYSWTELSTPAFKNTQAGLIAESLRWYNTKVDLQKGIYAEYSKSNFTFDVYYFNPFTSYSLVVASVTYAF